MPLSTLIVVEHNEPKGCRFLESTHKHGRKGNLEYLPESRSIAYEYFPRPFSAQM